MNSCICNKLFVCGVLAIFFASQNGCVTVENENKLLEDKFVKYRKEEQKRQKELERIKRQKELEARKREFQRQQQALQGKKYILNKISSTHIPLYRLKNGKMIESGMSLEYVRHLFSGYGITLQINGNPIKDGISIHANSGHERLSNFKNAPSRYNFIECDIYNKFQRDFEGTLLVALPAGDISNVKADGALLDCPVIGFMDLQWWRRKKDINIGRYMELFPDIKTVEYSTESYVNVQYGDTRGAERLKKSTKVMFNEKIIVEYDDFKILIVDKLFDDYFKSQER